MEALRMTPARQAHDWTFYVVLLAIAQVLIFAVSARAIDVPEECRVQNRGARCVAACVEVLGRVHNRQELFGYRDVGGEWLHPEKAALHLEAVKVPYTLETIGTHNYETIKQHARPRGVMVTLRAGTQGLSGYQLKNHHEIIVTDCNRTHVWMFDPDWPYHGHCRTWEWFKAGWAGDAVVIQPSKD
jgi:hypothetical protein